MAIPHVAVTLCEKVGTLPKTDLAPYPGVLQALWDGQMLGKALAQGQEGCPVATAWIPRGGAGDLWPQAPWAVRASGATQASLPRVSSGRWHGGGGPHLDTEAWGASTKST